MTSLQKSILRGVSQSVQTAASEEEREGASSPAEALANRYAGDPALLNMYAKRLAKRGWAGRMDAVEREYVKWVRRRREP